MTPEQQTETVRKYVMCVGEGNRRAALGFVQPDVRFLVPGQLPYGGTWTGRDEVDRLLATIERTWTDWEETPSPSELACAGHRVYRKVEFRATLAQTGHRVAMFLTELFEFRDDKIAEIRAYYADPAVVAESVGRAPRDLDDAPSET